LLTRKRLTFFLLTALCAAMTAPAAYAQIKYVAVVETEVDAQSGAAAKLNKAEVRQITAVLRKEALKNLPQEKYNIMTSETVQAQGGATLEECVDENCVITLGSRIGADFIVRGIISKFGTKLTVSVDIYETNDGNLVASSELVQSENTAGLLGMTATACGEMYKTFLNVLAQKSKPKATTTQTAMPPAPTSSPPTTQTYQQSKIDASGMLTDSRDGKTYKMVVIGGKRWMAENLNYEPKSGNSWCYVDKKTKANYCDKYGRLYDWNTAKTVCPAGYHLPSRQEWDNLVSAAGGKDAAGKRLKARSGWNDYKKKSGNGTDDFGFSALPSGNRFSNGSFNSVGYAGNWWTATEYGSGYAYIRGMGYFVDFVGEDYYDESGAFSVRCVRD
jgi:uncharacterized protein (TIGR02145 family)